MKTRIVLFAPALLAAAALLLLFAVLRLSSAALAAPLALQEEVVPIGVSEVIPKQAPNDLDTSLVVSGSGFTAVYSGTEIIQTPSVALNGLILEDAVFVDEATLLATVPWGLDPGAYTLTVENPDGTTASLVDAFTVTAGINVWTSGGPYGGSVTTLLINPVATGTLYAALEAPFSATGVGLFRSRDRGESWDLILNDTISHFSAAALSVPDPNTLYAHQKGSGLYRSDDGGDSWTLLPFPGHIHDDHRPFTHPTNPKVIYVASSDNLYYSADRGQSWSTRTSGMAAKDLTALAFDPSNPQILYAGTGTGTVYRSENAGLSWNSIGQPDQFIGVLAVNPFGSHEVWASGSDSGGHWGKLWKHQAGSWTQVIFGYSDNRMVGDIVFDPVISGTIRLAVHSGLVSIDGGSSWNEIGPQAAHSVAKLAVDPTNPNRIYLGYGGGGVSRTADGGATWEEANQGLSGIYTTGLALHPNEPAVVYALAHNMGVFKTNNGGGSWVRLPLNGSGAFSPVVDRFDSQRVMIGGGNGMDMSSDGGSTWSRADLSLPAKYAECCRLTIGVVVSTGEPGHWVAGANFFDPEASSYGYIDAAFYLSQNNGDSWEYIDVGEVISPVVSLAASPVDPGIIFAGTGQIDNGTGIWKSEDGGQTWVRSGLEGHAVVSIAFDPFDSQKIYASTRESHWEKFYVSKDGGQNWTLLHTSGGGIDHLLVIPTDPVTLYRYGYNGVLRSNSGGESWSVAAGSLGTAKVGSMTAVIQDERVILYVGTAGSLRAEATISAGSNRMLEEAPVLQAGVYRQTSLVSTKSVFLPVLFSR